jgi:GT2 family glycosyltransferase
MLTRTPSDSIGTPQLARIGDQLVLAVWQDRTAQADSFHPHLGRDALARPYAAVRLDAAAGLYSALLRLPRRAASGSLLRMGADARSSPAAALEAMAASPDAMIGGLPAAARVRLLSFLMETGAGLFGARRASAFLRACQILAASLHDAQQGQVRTARIIALLPDGAQLIALPAAQAPGAWHHLAADALRPVPASAVDDGIYLLAERAAAGDTLHAGGGEAPWRLAATASAVPHLLAWIETASSAHAVAVIGLVHAWAAAHGRSSAAVSALLHELALLRPRQVLRHDGSRHPVAAALELALPDGQGGLFLRGWLRDPHGLVGAMQLRLPWGEVTLPQAAMHGFARPDLVARFARAAHAGEAPQGFVAHLPDAGGAALQPELVLSLHSGAAITVIPPMRMLPAAAARDAVLASVPPPAASAAVMDQCLAPAARRLHQAALGQPRAAELVQIGAPVARPKISVLVPLYRTLSFLRAQVACFACDPAWADCETIFVLDSPEQRAEVEHLLRGLNLMHGLAFRLVVMPRNLGYAAANNAGAAVARAPLLLLLNSDVLPDAPGWLAALSAPLADRRVGAAGPKLLFEDGSIQHAGLFFDRDADGVWFNRHFFKGFPRRFAPAARARPVPAVTGAALLVRRELFERAGGISEDYIIGDYEDSDFCLKLRGLGVGIAYVPGAELWHFERRSITAHRGYTRTLASLYNKRLHHARWDGAIGTLMAGFGRGGRA